MIIIVDAYNVLKQALGVKHVADAAKQQFINLLSSYSKKKGHAVIVVFDGGPYEWPNKERTQGINVVHSGVNETADSWIKDYVERFRSHDLLLISTDRELGRCAARYNIQSLDALDFYRLLLEFKSERLSVQAVSRQKAVKITEREQEELDALMEAESRIVPTKAEDIAKEGGRKSKGQQLSKKERKILQKIKKL